MSQLKKSIKSRVDEFLTEHGVTETTLTCSGTGVNGGIQYLVLDSIGAGRLSDLKCVNLVSGSVYSYLCYLAWQENEMQFDLYDMKGWDKANRRWHDSSLLNGFGRIIKCLRTKKPMFANHILSDILANTVTPSFAGRLVSSLPKNCKIWTFNKTSGEFVAITADGPFKDCLLRDVVRFSSSVPALYGTFQYGGDKFIDPVYSGKYSKLLKRFRTEAAAHLITNLFEDNRKGDTLFIKPHSFRNPKLMITDDFLRMLLNIPNARINTAHKNAFSAKEPNR